jgi:hypothetical protein
MCAHPIEDVQAQPHDWNNVGDVNMSDKVRAGENLLFGSCETPNGNMLLTWRFRLVHAAYALHWAMQLLCA